MKKILVFFAESHGLSCDCPPWPGIEQYACTIAGATMTACDCLRRQADGAAAGVLINWCGSWHHAQKDTATGIYYINDIVSGILVLSTKFNRIYRHWRDNHHRGAFASI